MTSQRPRVMIIGAGFGGLFAAREFAGQPVDVLLIDRNNFHTFTPLLYQVATAALDPSQIAHPVRSIFRKVQNVSFLLGEVTGIDDEARTVAITAGDRHLVEPYDYLIVAAGSVPNYFGNDEFRSNAFELRTLRDSVRLRNHILNLFEEAVWTTDEARRQALLTIVVIGGGPTGLETAGAVYELYNHVLNREFPQEHLHTRVILVERSPHLLDPYPPKLREAALRQAQSLGIEVMLGHGLAEAASTYVRLDDGTVIDTHTLIWGAGVKAAPLATLLTVPLERSGRIPVAPTTQVVGKPHLYAIGDIAHLPDPTGRPYPMLIPVAQQQGKLAAHNILAAVAGTAQQPFVYRDKGTMATIGRSRAVAWIFNRIQLTGLMAWFAWLGLHLVMLLGFSNRITVFIDWAWNYLTYDRSVRIIWVQEKEEPTQRERFPDLFAPIRDEPPGDVTVTTQATPNAANGNAPTPDSVPQKEGIREA